MVGQVLRQFGRAIAAYFSDVLLWLSVAGALEVVAVFGMAALCILSAGYFFENMKKNPLVLVLGGVVALTGTFLMFREVRGFIWPPPPAAVAAPIPAPPSEPAPEATLPSPSVAPKPALQLDNTGCSGKTGFACTFNPKCQWLETVFLCVSRPTTDPASPSPTWLFPRSYEGSACTALPLTTCMTTGSCYWSSLFNRCEKLIVGTGLTSPTQPATQASCWGMSEMQCRASSDCLWRLGICMTDYSKSDPPK